MMELNLKDWLRERGCLEAFARNRLSDDDWEGDEAPDLDYPRGWIGKSFYGYRTVDPEYTEVYWSDLHLEWSAEVSKHLECYPDGAVVPGIPLDDRLGMSLFVAKLEEADHE